MRPTGRCGPRTDDRGGSAEHAGLQDTPVICGDFARMDEADHFKMMRTSRKGRLKAEAV